MKRMIGRLVIGATLGLGWGLLASEAGFETLFNGRDLGGWEGNPKLWSVRDGAITGVTQADPKLTHNTFLVYTNRTFDDFELRLSYRIVAGNSGIQYRSRVLRQGDFGPVVGGYQADFEAGRTYSGILYEENGRGILAQRGQKTVIRADATDGSKHKVEVVGSVGESDAIQAVIRNEDWNDYVIIARGNHLQHFINGQQTVDVVDEHAARAARSGVIAFQIHVGPPMVVQFKDVRIKPLVAAVQGGIRDKKIVLVAGGPSHGPGEHEHRAGCLLLARCLEPLPGIQTLVVSNGWPTDESVFEEADLILFYCDGGGGHPAVQGERLEKLGHLIDKNVGFLCLHYGVEVPKERGGRQFLDWMGGYFEAHWSVNPHWDAEFKTLPEHPITRGVKPFTIRDEWYYHMRFQAGQKGVTPILTAMPPESTLKRSDGPHSGNPDVRAAVLERGEAQHVAWAYERPNGGRGFGFTGGHFHRNWGHDDFRKLVLNAVLWVAKAEVPAGGVDSVVTAEDLEKDLDPKRR
jgi:type 1 glutamine amidotransferase